MTQALRALLLYMTALVALWPAFRTEDGAPEGALPPLPAEAALVSPPGRGLCGSQALERSLEARAFRWVYRQGARPPVWRRGLTIVCDDAAADALALAVLDGKRTVYRTTYARPAGAEGGDTAIRVAARLLPLEPAVAEAAVRVFLDNQPDVARAGADLWRARRWREASEVLWTALENDWADEAQADLYFGLADAQAQLGRPRQAYWYALAYMGASGKNPPEAWLRGLRGAAGAAVVGGAVEPEAEALARRWRQAVADRRWDAALDALKALCRTAPWADSYQDAVAQIYQNLGWTPLAESWRRRAALTRRLAADERLQAELAGLLR